MESRAETPAETVRASPPPPSPPPAPARREQLKTPGLAAMLSAVPGLGNIYNGLYMRGFAFFLIFVSIIALLTQAREDTEFAFLGPSLAFFWFFNIFDAYRQATMINLGHGPDLGLIDRPRLGRSGLFPGVVLVVLGLYGLLHKYFHVDLSWIFEQWPIIILAFGAFLIYQALAKKREAGSELEY